MRCYKIMIYDRQKRQIDHQKIYADNITQAQEFEKIFIASYQAFFTEVIEVKLDPQDLVKTLTAAMMILLVLISPIDMGQRCRARTRTRTRQEYNLNNGDDDER